MVRLVTDVGLVTAGPDELVGMIPTDHVAWPEAVAARVTERAAAATTATDRVVDRSARAIWLSGAISPMARQNLEALG